MVKKILSFTQILFFLLTLVSCEVINPEERVPAYLRFENVTLQTDTTTQGSASHKIVDVWIYVDNEPRGAYEMPVSVPVLGESNHEVKVRGGIMVNGIAATRVYYPFYNFHTETINFVPGSVTQLNPVVSYFSDVVFSLNESFSGAGTSLASTPQSDTTLQVITDSSHTFENQTAKVILDNQHLIFECASVDSLSLPADGTPVYMELNYKTNTEFSVGLYAITSTIIFPLPVLTVRTSSEWNKIYINLSDAAVTVPAATGFKPYIHMQRNSSVGDAELYFDNVKVVHF
jgi:hypothetical protein